MEASSATCVPAFVTGVPLTLTFPAMMRACARSREIAAPSATATSRRRLGEVVFVLVGFVRIVVGVICVVADRRHDAAQRFLHLDLRLGEQVAARLRELRAFFEERDGFIKRHVAVVEQFDDLFESSEAFLEVGCTVCGSALLTRRRLGHLLPPSPSRWRSRALDAVGYSAGHPP